MYITDVVWWAYTVVVALIALFMLYFGRKVQHGKGE